jgi:hypothetical protein
MSASQAWAEAFLAAQRQMPPIPKTNTAEIKTDRGAYSYSYADLASILDLVLPILGENGLALAQSTVTVGTQVGVETRIYHTGGHVETFGPLLLPGGTTPQNAGSAVTYARRYALTAALGLAPDDDDDAEAASRPSFEPVELTPGKWLADAVLVFKSWEAGDRRTAYKKAMTELALSALETIADAERVFDFMTGLYYEAFPSDATRPF